MGPAPLFLRSFIPILECEPIINFIVIKSTLLLVTIKTTRPTIRNFCRFRRANKREMQTPLFLFFDRYPVRRKTTLYRDILFRPELFFFSEARYHSCLSVQDSLSTLDFWKWRVAGKKGLHNYFSMDKINGRTCDRDLTSSNIINAIFPVERRRSDSLCMKFYGFLTLFVVNNGD